MWTGGFAHRLVLSPYLPRLADRIARGVRDGTAAANT